MKRVLPGLALAAMLAVLPSFGSQGEGSMEPVLAHADAALFVAERTTAARREGLLSRADSAAAALIIEPLVTSAD
jgi:hypothetical protein